MINVSWFAAQAYCRSLDKRLPTVAEWERVASASKTHADGRQEKSYHQRILEWYSQPSRKQLPEVGDKAANFWGVQDLHGLIWEWTEDFNSALVSGESRGDSSIDQKLFLCSRSSRCSRPQRLRRVYAFWFSLQLTSKIYPA